jgi:hypothetical protein
MNVLVPRKRLHLVSHSNSIIVKRCLFLSAFILIYAKKFTTMTNPLSLSSLPESHLLTGLKNAVSEERKWTQLILEYLLECDRRGLHLKLGFASLHEFSVQYLGLSDGAAHRRIQSMRLMAGVPAVSEKIASGALTLSNAAKL